MRRGAHSIRRHERASKHRGAHSMKRAAAPRDLGAHSMRRDAGTAKRRGAHAMRRSSRPTSKSARTLTRRTPAILAAVTSLALGLGGGVAYAYLTTTGTGPGAAAAGNPVTITVTATTGTADLLPGGTGAVYFVLTNINSFGATFNTVAVGATAVSQDTANCPSTNISIAQTLPYLFSPSVTVSANTTSGGQAIPNLVKLSPTAPTGCQGVKFTVTFTLSGIST